MVREAIATWFVRSGRSIGRLLGCELKVDVSDHSIQTSMVKPDKERWAWDDTLYKKGCLFVDGYANPVKPSVDYNKDLEDPDTVTVKESEQQATEDDTEDSEEHVSMISSPRYREYMRQDLISQMLNPREQWRLVVYAVIALAVLMLGNVFISLSAAGLI